MFKFIKDFFKDLFFAKKECQHVYGNMYKYSGGKKLVPVCMKCGKIKNKN